jgi:hypothetical protein
MPSNASVQTVQSLGRVQDSEYGFAARSWLGCYFLWRGMGKEATGTAGRIMRGFLEGEWSGPAPGSDEDAVDAWLAASMVFLVNTHRQTVRIVMKTFAEAMERARRSGDVVRAARVAAVYLWACAEGGDDVRRISKEWDGVFEEARRVGDGFAFGFRAMALGRWHVGPGGLKVAKTEGRAVAERAMEYLTEAARLFDRQGMDPWRVFTGVQLAKALTDLGRYDEMDAAVKALDGEVDRFPILESHLYEAVWQIHRAFGKADADAWYRRALESAEKNGLEGRVEILKEMGDRNRNA